MAPGPLCPGAWSKLLCHGEVQGLNFLQKFLAAFFSVCAVQAPVEALLQPKAPVLWIWQKAPHQSQEGANVRTSHGENFGLYGAFVFWRLALCGQGFQGRALRDACGNAGNWSSQRLILPRKNGKSCALFGACCIL